MPGVDARFWLLPFSLALIIIISSLRIPRWVFFLLISLPPFLQTLSVYPHSSVALLQGRTKHFTRTHTNASLKHAQSNRLWSLLLRRRCRHPPTRARLPKRRRSDYVRRLRVCRRRADDNKRTVNAAAPNIPDARSTLTATCTTTTTTHCQNIFIYCRHDLDTVVVIGNLFRFR